MGRRQTNPYRRRPSDENDEGRKEHQTRAGSEDNQHTMRLRGGFGFEFAYLDTSPVEPYNGIKAGLNLKGKCCNPQCVLFDKVVFFNAGFHHSFLPSLTLSTLNGFNIGEMIHKATCPGCKNQMNPKHVDSCVFTGCEYAYEGYRLTCKYPRQGSGTVEETEVKKHYAEFSLVEWTVLTIAVRPLDYLLTVAKKAATTALSLAVPFLGRFVLRFFMT